jgi:hypothetical protein
MWPALPAPEYYDGSATTRHPQRASRLPATLPGWEVGRAASGRFPRSLLFRSTGSVPSYTPTASPSPHIAVLDRTSRRPSASGDESEAPISHKRSSTAARPIHRSWRAADDSRGFVHWFGFPTPFCLACGHPPSGGTDGPLRCQSCSRPRPRPGVRPALSFNRSLRRPAAEPFHPHTEHQRLAAHARSHRSRSASAPPADRRRRRVRRPPGR